LGNLSNLVFLDLRSLPLLIGSIPVELGKLSNLAALHLENTQVSGSIPAALGNLTKLVHLYLNNTQLGGSVPTELGNLTNLVQIYLNSNQLGGQIPQGITSRIGNGITKYDLDNAPYLSTIANQSTTSDKPLTLTLSVSDIDTAGNADPTVLTLKAVSDNSALIGESGISVSGTGSDRILTLTPTPGQTGTATITLTLQDDSGEKTEKTFIVTVNASSISTTPGTGTTPPAVTPISSITSLFNAAKSEFIVSDALLSLNPETLPSGSLFRLRQGTPKADKLQGTGSKEAIFGKANNDLIKGQGGNDCLSGGKGNDLLYGGAGNDLIFGDAGNDTLVGEAGNDVLIGGAGSDRITTGTGSDQVGFAKPIGSKSIDTITDFNAKVDHIVVSAKGFGGGLVAGQVLSTTQFQTGTKAIGSANRFIYNRKTGDLFFDADGSGAGKAIAFTHLNPGLHLTSQNISIV
jgi:Ca2+-binding RTX toxin-like protein